MERLPATSTITLNNYYYMNLHELLSSPDRSNVHLAVAMRDMWTEQEWTDTIYNIYNQCLLDPVVGLWVIGYHNHKSIASNIDDTVEVRYIYLIGTRVAAAHYNLTGDIRIFMLNLGTYPDEPLTVAEAISKTVNTWS